MIYTRCRLNSVTGAKYPEIRRIWSRSYGGWQAFNLHRHFQVIMIIMKESNSKIGRKSVDSEFGMQYDGSVDRVILGRLCPVEI